MVLTPPAFIHEIRNVFKSSWPKFWFLKKIYQLLEPSPSKLTGDTTLFRSCIFTSERREIVCFLSIYFHVHPFVLRAKAPKLITYIIIINTYSFRLRAVQSVPNILWLYDIYRMPPQKDQDLNWDTRPRGLSIPCSSCASFLRDLRLPAEIEREL